MGLKLFCTFGIMKFDFSPKSLKLSNQSYEDQRLTLKSILFIGHIVQVKFSQLLQLDN